MTVLSDVRLSVWLLPDQELHLVLLFLFFPCLFNHTSVYMLLIKLKVKYFELSWLGPACADQLSNSPKSKLYSPLPSSLFNFIPAVTPPPRPSACRKTIYISRSCAFSSGTNLFWPVKNKQHKWIKVILCGTAAVSLDGCPTLEMTHNSNTHTHKTTSSHFFPPLNGDFIESEHLEQ